MAQEFIIIGNKIEMKLVKQGSISVKDDKPVYISQFVQWTKERVAQIAVPMYKGQRIPVRVGDEYQLTFYTPKGLYRCLAVILEQSVHGQLPTSSVRLASDMEKYQRRQFYRMECILPLTYAVLTEEQKKLYTDFRECTEPEQKEALRLKIQMEPIEFFEGTALDISGGGMRFNSAIQQSENDTLLLMPELPQATRQKVPFLFARLISSSPLQKKEAVFDNRVEYIDISVKERELLICYIFKEERERRKRELELV